MLKSISKVLMVGLSVLTLAACSTTEDRIGGAGAGALVGSVAGPIGAGVGGVAGAIVGPTVVRHVVNGHRHYYHRHYYHGRHYRYHHRVYHHTNG